MCECQIMLHSLSLSPFLNYHSLDYYRYFTFWLIIANDSVTVLLCPVQFQFQSPALFACLLACLLAYCTLRKERNENEIGLAGERGGEGKALTIYRYIFSHSARKRLFLPYSSAVGCSRAKRKEEREHFPYIHRYSLFDTQKRAWEKK